MTEQFRYTPDQANEIAKHTLIFKNVEKDSYRDYEVAVNTWLINTVYREFGGLDLSAIEHALRDNNSLLHFLAIPTKSVRSKKHLSYLDFASRFPKDPINEDKEYILKICFSSKYLEEVCQHYGFEYDQSKNYANLNNCGFLMKRYQGNQSLN